MPFVTDSGVWRSLVDEGSRCTVSHRLSTFAFVHPHMQSLSLKRSWPLEILSGSMKV